MKQCECEKLIHLDRLPQRPCKTLGVVVLNNGSGPYHGICFGPGVSASLKERKA